MDYNRIYRKKDLVDLIEQKINLNKTENQINNLLDRDKNIYKVK